MTENNEGLVEPEIRHFIEEPILKGKPQEDIIDGIEQDLNRLSDFVREAVVESRIVVRNKRLTKEDSHLILIGLVLNKNTSIILADVNAQRVKRGDKALALQEMAIHRYRQRYHPVILAVRKLIFEKLPDIFSYTNPIYVVARYNMLANHLWRLGVNRGLANDLIDKDTQGIIRLYIATIRNMSQVIEMNVESLREKIQDTDGDNINLDQFLKKLRKKMGNNVSEEKAIDLLLKDRFKDQITTGAENVEVESEKNIQVDVQT